ncbi:hypothetical protein POM88_022552 [Heracleum sosnowskyi]|uniref:HMA domain-containing protein n=1 Tax=Heracleum sosnowskyi TaxID=360622 RepID=A0AAD8IF75_9APIA|nr:hypothetical protein POM88_022552 [Heracleum sosnowskyi]
MDHQEQSIKMIEERYAAMTLEEEEAGGVEYEELEGEEEGIDTRLFEQEGEITERLYGVWLRAITRRSVQTLGSKWLRSEPVSSRQLDGKGVGETRVGNGQGNAADNQAENPGTENTEGEKSGVMDMDENSGSLNSNMPNKVAPGVIGGSSGNSEFEGGDDIGPNGGIIIADPKRRRIEEENDGPGIIGSMGLNQIGLQKTDRSCWAIVGLDGVGNQYSSFQSWMEEVSNTCSEKLELAGMLCWGIWKARNELVWNSSASRAARDSAGEMIEAKASVYSGVMDSQCAEAIGIREALSWIKNEQEHAGAMGLDTQLSYIIESDCQSIVQAIKNASTMLSPIGLCVLKVNCKCEQCKMKLMSVLSSISGVYSVNIDAERGLAEIEGQVDPNHLLQEVSRSGEHAELVSVRLQHPAARQRYSSYDRENNNYNYGRSMNAIQDGYGRRALLNHEPYYVNSDERYYNHNLNYALPEVSNYTNSRYNMNDYDYTSRARYVPSSVPREYNPYEEEPLSCTIL